MSTQFSGVNYADTQTSPPTQINQGQYNAPTLHILDQYVLTGDLAVGDTILLGGVIPEGSTLLDATLTTGALGGSCTVSLGYQASASGPTGSLPAQAADLTAFFNTVAVSSATVAKAHGNGAEGDFYTQVALTAAVQPILTCVAVSSGATGKSIMVDIVYTKCGG